MIDTLLHARLQPLIERRRQTVLWLSIAAVWTLAFLAVLAAGWLRHRGVWVPRSAAAWMIAAAVAACAAFWLRSSVAAPDLRRLARLLEARHRDLDGRLLTAIQQTPDPKGDYSFLQERLFEDAVRHSVDHNWEALAPGWRVAGARMAAGLALVACLAAVQTLRPPARPAPAVSAAGETNVDGVTVTPGDTSLERGSRLTVLVRFDQTVPTSADLVVGTSAASERRIPLVRSLSDPVFGGTVADVADGFSYRIEYAGRRTRDFKVSVFEFPRLERSDVELTAPAYTGLPVQRIEDTRRVSAVEGTRVALTLQLNKPVASATLTPKEGKATPVALTPDPARAIASLSEFPLTASQSYELRLVDADGRTNVSPDLFVFDALPNRPPELKLTAPRGDLRPSALEEIVFQGTAWDDFGVLACGIGISRGGQAPEIIQLGGDSPAKAPVAIRHVLRLEAAEAKPDELFSWFAWADDIGPDGQRRRTQGDLFFAEVRPFDEVFREGAGTAGAESQPGESQDGQQGSPATRLAELQKQIINATWKLERGRPPAEAFAKDAVVVRDSQRQAAEQARAAGGEAEEPMRAALWKAVTGEMDKAVQSLDEAPAAPARLPAALVAEQSAYQALLKLRERETEVNRSRRPPQGQASAGEQQRQDQLDELELDESENRYETQRQAQPQQNAERRARMQVQNRLQELARRQEEVNEKLRELQASLQAAPDDPQREELRRQLKRLEEEQRQMLADMDELRQRMDRPEMQSQMSRQRQQLDQSRQDSQRAAESASRGDVPQALAAGTRAQRQLQEMRDQLRKESAGELAEELRQMRGEARDLARRQQEITRSLDGQDTPPPPSLSEATPEEKAAEKLADQRERAAALVDRATKLSEEAEASEPLVSRQLYDSLRKFSQTDAASLKEARESLIREGTMTQPLYRQLEELQEKPQPGQALSLASELLRAELNDPARRAARQAGTGLEQLRGGVEKAAEKVLGDDTAALQAAEKELASLADELAGEAAAARDQASAPGQRGSTDRTGPATPATPDGPKETAENSSGRSPGDAGQPPVTSPTGQPSAAPPPGDTPPPGSPPPGQPDGPQQAANAQPEGSRSGQPQPGGRSPGSPGRASEDTAERVSRMISESGATSGGGGGGGAPITGEGFTNWSDRLREVEEMVDSPDLRTAVASARERARVLRREAQRDLKKPDWAVVELEILKPLVEVRQQVRDELRRRSADDPLAPIDRDPVPDRFAELVRRYYEELGRDK